MFPGHIRSPQKLSFPPFRPHLHPLPFIDCSFDVQKWLKSQTIQSQICSHNETNLCFAAIGTHYIPEHASRFIADFAQFPFPMLHSIGHHPNYATSPWNQRSEQIIRDLLGTWSPGQNPIISLGTFALADFQNLSVNVKEILLSPTQPLSQGPEFFIDSFTSQSDSHIIYPSFAILKSQLELAAISRRPVHLTSLTKPFERGLSHIIRLAEIVQHESNFSIPSFILEDFPGTLDTSLLHKALDLNFFIGISNSITYDSFSLLRNQLSEIPLDRILITSRAPFFSPPDFNNSQAFLNESSNGIYVIDALALILAKYGITREQIASYCFINSFTAHPLLSKFALSEGKPTNALSNPSEINLDQKNASSSAGSISSNFDSDPPSTKDKKIHPSVDIISDNDDLQATLSFLAEDELYFETDDSKSDGFKYSLGAHESPSLPKPSITSTENYSENDFPSISPHLFLDEKDNQITSSGDELQFLDLGFLKSIRKQAFHLDNSQKQYLPRRTGSYSRFHRYFGNTDVSHIKKFRNPLYFHSHKDNLSSSLDPSLVTKPWLPDSQGNLLDGCFYPTSMLRLFPNAQVSDIARVLDRAATYSVLGGLAHSYSFTDFEQHFIPLFNHLKTFKSFFCIGSMPSRSLDWHNSENPIHQMKSLIETYSASSQSRGYVADISDTDSIESPFSIELGFGVDSPLVSPHANILGRMNQKTPVNIQPQIVGIGKIGIFHPSISGSYFPFLDSPTHENIRSYQIQMFEQQLQLASDFGLSVSTTQIGDFPTFFGVLKNFPNLKGIYSVSYPHLKQLKQIVDFGFSLSISSLFSKRMENVDSHNPNSLVDILLWAPKDRLIFESSAPFYAPDEHRLLTKQYNLSDPLLGIHNPVNLQFTIQAASEILKKDPADISIQNSLNIRRIFPPLGKLMIFKNLFARQTKIGGNPNPSIPTWEWISDPAQESKDVLFSNSKTEKLRFIGENNSNNSSENKRPRPYDFRKKRKLI